MANPYERSIKEGIRYHRKLGRILAQLGTKRNPRGKVLSQYNATRKELAKELKKTQVNQAGVSMILDSHRASVMGFTGQALRSGITVGLESAEKQLSYYDEMVLSGLGVGLVSSLELEASAAILLALNTQITSIEGMVLAGVAPELIIGGMGLVGVLKPSAVILPTSFWVNQLAAQSFNGLIQSVMVRTQKVFQKQAVAGLDEKTTDCCLMVHGQIRGLNEEFITDGSPAWAPRQMSPPFHNYCRTSQVLYQGKYDDGLTERMRYGADVLIGERERGILREIHPANAFLEDSD